ncbi:MAG: 50S ribosomal protein L21 [Deltaproteobacteria bacterium]|nr:50S ribosomal protein L21 [Deltaproteobacteria bacterium]
MYAVVRTGGKQQRVEPGERLKVEKLDGEVGAEISLNEVLFIGGEGEPKIGQPVLTDAKVTAKILSHGRGEKIRVFKRRKRKGFHKTIGHRQEYTELEILGIAE